AGFLKQGTLRFFFGLIDHGYGSEGKWTSVERETSATSPQTACMVPKLPIKIPPALIKIT
ncbi:MAG: hypothetical protein NTU84_05390, partial [Verrucomicrobia bacterium]|nr:hypothetical protein [Verrucomicrobiota bacterium]